METSARMTYLADIIDGPNKFLLFEASRSSEVKSHFVIEMASMRKATSKDRFEWLNVEIASINDGTSGNEYILHILRDGSLFIAKYNTEHHNGKIFTVEWSPILEN